MELCRQQTAWFMKIAASQSAFGSQQLFPHADTSKNDIRVCISSVFTVHVTERHNPLSMPFETVLKSIWQSCLSSPISVYHRRAVTFIHTERGGGGLQSKQGIQAFTARYFQRLNVNILVWLEWWPNVPLPHGFPGAFCPCPAAQTKLAALHSRPHNPDAACPTPSKSAVLRFLLGTCAERPSARIPAFSGCGFHCLPHFFFPPMKGKSNVLCTDLPLVCSVLSHPSQLLSHLPCGEQDRYWQEQADSSDG